MRACVIVPLILAALFGLGLRYGSTKAPQRSDRAPAAAPARTPKPPARGEVHTILWSAKVSGPFQTNEKDAFDASFRKAGLEMSDYLRTRNPSIVWVPTPEFLREEKHKIVKDHKIETHTLEVDAPDPPTMLSVTLELELTDTALKAIQEQDRHFRVEKRLWDLGRGLAGLVLILGTIAGAIRLDEWTKGYFPLPLKLGLVTLAGAGAAAVWLIA